MHTSKCKVCQDVLKKVKKVRLIVAALVFLVAVWWSGGNIASTISVSVFGGVRYLAHKLTK